MQKLAMRLPTLCAGACMQASLAVWLLLTDGRLVADILKQDVECLQQLQADIATALLSERLQEERLHVLLQEVARSGHKPLLITATLYTPHCYRLHL